MRSVHMICAVQSFWQNLVKDDVGQSKPNRHLHPLSRGEESFLVREKYGHTVNEFLGRARWPGGGEGGVIWSEGRRWGSFCRGNAIR